MRVDANDMGADLEKVLITKEEIDAKLIELAAKIDAEYAGKDLLIVGVLKGAVMVMADLPGRCPPPSPWTGWPCPPTARAPSPPASSGS